VTTKIRLVNRSARERYETEKKLWEEEKTRREQQLEEARPPLIEAELYEGTDEGPMVVFEHASKPSRNIVAMPGMYFYENGVDSLVIHPDEIGDEPRDIWEQVE